MLSLRCSEVVSRSPNKTVSFVKEIPFGFCSRKLPISLHPIYSLFFKLLQENYILSGKIDFMGLLAKKIDLFTFLAPKNMVGKPIQFLLSHAQCSSFVRFLGVDLHPRIVNVLSLRYVQSLSVLRSTNKSWKCTSVKYEKCH